MRATSALISPTPIRQRPPIRQQAWGHGDLSQRGRNAAIYESVGHRLGRSDTLESSPIPGRSH